MAQVPKTPTPLTPRQMAKVFREGAKRAGLPDDPVLLSALMGIIGIENANGRSIIQHNWGNIMATKGWIASGKDFWGRPHSDAGQPQGFRAYPTHNAGVDDFFRIITGKRHKGVLVPAKAGDPRAVGEALFDSNYITPVKGKPVQKQIDDYSKGIAFFFNRYLRDGLFGPSQQPPLTPGEPTDPKDPEAGSSSDSPQLPAWAGLSNGGLRLPRLELSSQGAVVQVAQTFLNRFAGRRVLKPDGDFGPITRGYVEVFQSKREIQRDGIVAEETWNELLKVNQQ